MERKLRVIDIDNSFVDKLVALYFSLAFFLASAIGAFVLDERGEVLQGLYRIISSPSPLITDYFVLGSLPSAFLNAGLCGLSCTLLMFLLKAKCNYTTYAGFFLVVAHCFYGLNILNMWPPILGIVVYCRLTHNHFSDKLALAFYATAFAPFISELLFRYPLTHGNVWAGVFAVLALSLFLGFSVPAMLDGAKLLHREMSLYNGGLAFGLLGMLVFSFLYNILGVEVPSSVNFPPSKGNGYIVFANVFFLTVFFIAIIIGWYLNGGSFRGYGKLLEDPGFKTDFLEKYGDGVTMINMGVYGLMMVLYFDVVILLTNGNGWGGATFGIVLACVTFSASGQHIRNVWPILSGYFLLGALVYLLSLVTPIEITWTLSTQAYMNGAAFATGLCPFTGRYGKRVGLAAGFIAAILSAATIRMHGGFMLYNGGLVAGMTALVLSPLLDHYYPFSEE